MLKWFKAVCLTAAMMYVIPASAVDPTFDVERSWSGALVVMPTLPGVDPVIARMTDAINYNYFAAVKRGTPVAIYLHGSTGIEKGHIHDMKVLAQGGFISIAPDSFKRKGRKMQCDLNMNCGGFPDAHKWRIEEIRYSLVMLRTQPWVDTNRLILMGHSEGAIAAGNWRGTEFRAVILHGWMCRNYDEQTSGLKTPSTVPVLNITSSKDEKWPSRYWGTCERDLKGKWQAHWEVISPAGVTDHYLGARPEVEQKLIEFARRFTQ
ncbi:hypothetical protein FHP25_28255 [Vineibacter terrae]|uniref:Dienelactone hydrolase domain-containing protein n=1 Tax=Vineibacter terrae TaxID=2586908 RepID=A0A5C8PDD7_9HYPH|nr:hypothetical protein [Vineibacter terrae]TXL71766.1 hypothetical protein FHP25_28255 [Vineibacter terrae]